MSTRKTWKLFVAVMAGCMLLLGNQDAMAAKLTTGQLKKGCGKLGGVYFPPGAGGAYACLAGDSLTICDGQVPAGHQYCQTYRTVGGGGLTNLQTRRILKSRGAATGPDQMRCISCYQSCAVGDIRCRSRCNLTSSCIGATTIR